MREEGDAGARDLGMPEGRFSADGESVREISRSRPSPPPGTGSVGASSRSRPASWIMGGFANEDGRGQEPAPTGPNP